MMSTRLKERIKSNEFNESLVANIVAVYGFLEEATDYETWGELEINFDTFCEVLQHMYDDSGIFIQERSIIVAQTKALTHMMATIEDELQEEQQSRASLEAELEARSKQHESNYQELMQSSSGQIASAEDKIRELSSEARKLRTDDQSNGKKLAVVEAENAELREAVKRSKASERQKKELEDLRAEHEVLREECMVLEAEKVAVQRDAEDEIGTLLSMLDERAEAHAEVAARLEEASGKDIKLLRKQLAAMEECMAQQQQAFARQLQDAQDARLRSRRNSMSSVEPGGYGSLGAELSAAMMQNSSSNLSRLPSGLGNPHETSLSRNPSLQSQPQPTPRRGRMGDTRHQSRASSSASTGSLQSDLGSTASTQARGSRPASGAAVSNQHSASAARVDDDLRGMHAQHQDSMHKKNAQIENLIREMSVLRGEVKTASLGDLTDPDLYREVPRKWRSPEPTTNTNLPPAVESVNVSIASVGTSDRSGVSPDVRIQELEELLRQQETQLQAALAGVGLQKPQGSQQADKLTSKVTVKVEKEEIKRRRGRDGGLNVAAVDRDAHTEVYFTTARVKSVARGPWSDAETSTLITAYKQRGPDYTELAKYLPGRTDRMIRDHCRATAGPGSSPCDVAYTVQL